MLGVNAKKQHTWTDSTPLYIDAAPFLCVFQKMQQLEERRVRKLGEGYGLLADTERNTLPSVSQSLEKISAYSSNTFEKQVHTHTHTFVSLSL